MNTDDVKKVAILNLNLRNGNEKIILLSSLCLSTAVFAAATVNNGESANQCMQYKQQMMKNHQTIDAAYHKNDACTMGKLMIQNRQMFESHPECFPHG